ncbi:MAG: hypothetical protein KIS89_04745 [Dokdonella sp.]|uniref:hypothetical protein n=1 Tax=Dokdonella sp. TaxID=2291710 RepID=UPI0027BAEA1A|nr:hypothetical protein [Dokdonella sp.]MCW5577929.1 hypothetical protein [Dokdonella sp.]
MDMFSTKSIQTKIECPPDRRAFRAMQGLRQRARRRRHHASAPYNMLNRNLKRHPQQNGGVWCSVARTLARTSQAVVAGIGAGSAKPPRALRRARPRLHHRPIKD